MTTRTPSIVSEVSAIEVASTILRRPGAAGATARSCARASIAPNSGAMSTAGFLTRSASSAATRAISPCPGRKTRIEPRLARQRVHARRARPRPRCAGAGRGRHSASRRETRGPALSIWVGAGHQPRDARAIERRRHHEEAKILAQALLRIERKREAKIGVERALVELVEQHRRNAFERGIVEDHAREHAFRDDLDPRARGDEALQAHAKADGLADLLAQSRGHTRGGGARGEAARLQHDDLARFRERLVEQRERNPRRLAGAGRGDQHGASSWRARPRQAREARRRSGGRRGRRASR